MNADQMTSALNEFNLKQLDWGENASRPGIEYFLLVFSIVVRSYAASIDFSLQSIHNELLLECVLVQVVHRE